MTQSQLIEWSLDNLKLANCAGCGVIVARDPTYSIIETLPEPVLIQLDLFHRRIYKLLRFWHGRPYCASCCMSDLVYDILDVDPARVRDTKLADPRFIHFQETINGA